jgi:hypothetical protein
VWAGIQLAWNESRWRSVVTTVTKFMTLGKLVLCKVETPGSSRLTRSLLPKAGHFNTSVHEVLLLLLLLLFGASSSSRSINLSISCPLNFFS